MIKYIILKKLIGNDRWLSDGIVYHDGEKCYFHRNGQTIRYHRDDLNQLNEDDFPVEEGSEFAWGEMEEWTKSEPFNAQVLLSQSDESSTLNLADNNTLEKLQKTIESFINQINQMDRAKVDLLKKHFEELYMLQEAYELNNEQTFFPQSLIKALWQVWGKYREGPIFNKPEHNVTLLLYARAFGLPVEENNVQKEYLDQYKEMYYSPLVPNSAGWGARASLSPNILAMLDSPVMQVFVSDKDKNPERIIIVGKGLNKFREQVFSDALVTAMRVQASTLDIFNDGLIIIERNQDVTDALQIPFFALGSDAPLSAMKSSDAAMRELIRSLERLEQDTGFVQVHQVDSSDVTEVTNKLYQLLQRALTNQEIILWAPDEEVVKSGKELVTYQLIRSFPPSQQRTPFGAQAHRRKRVKSSLLSLSLNPQLLATDSFKRLLKAYYEEVIERILIDATIRLDFYNRRASGLKSEKDQWDKSDEQQRLNRWGQTVSLNQRFDDEVGLIIWLQRPEIVATKKYYEEHVPSLIMSYENWALKMKEIIESLKTASERRDQPFNRLITTRFFDAAIRNCDLEDYPRIKKYFDHWVSPITDLLNFEWRRKFRAMKVDPNQVFSAHISFNLLQQLKGNAIVGLRILPYNLFDVKRSVLLIDPKKRFTIINDASDFPQQAPDELPNIDIKKEILEASDDNIENAQKKLYDFLIQNPHAGSKLIIEMLKPDVSEQVMNDSNDQIIKQYENGVAHAKFVRLVDTANTAMRNDALLTAREKLNNAINILPELLAKWKMMRESEPTERNEQLPAIPEINELKCRLYLLMTIAECLALKSNIDLKEHLASIYRSPRTSGRQEIYDTLAEADRADNVYTEEWIKYLSQWDFVMATNKLLRDLPSQRDLITFAEHNAIQIFESINLIKIIAELQKASSSLSNYQETRESALIKLGPNLEPAIFAYAANLVYGDLISLFEILTGRQAAYKRGGE